MNTHDPDRIILSDLQAELARKIIALTKTGHWREGEHISELRLANELGTSRTPVRHVLQFLEQFDVFTKTPNVGFRFKAPPSRELALETSLPRSEIENLYQKVMIARANGAIGTEVSETELAQYFDTTRGAIRRTLMRFANAGLAERRTGHGWQFAETLDNLDAIYESYAYRIIIECGAVRDPGFSPVPEQLAGLQNQQERLLAASVGEIAAADWFAANAYFHATIVSWAGNRFLSEAIERQNRLRQMTEVAEFTSLAEDRIRKSARDHLAILAAISSGDQSRAADLLYDHLRRDRD